MRLASSWKYYAFCKQCWESDNCSSTRKKQGIDVDCCRRLGCFFFIASMGTGNLNACHSSLLMIGDVKAEGLFKREQDVMPYTPLGLWFASTAAC